VRICQLCSNEKKDTEFRLFGRGRRKVCLACENGVATEAASIADQLPEPVTIGASLELPAGFGFRASIESGRFCIEQDCTAEDGQLRTDNITLMPHEARQLIEWIEQQIGQAEAA
jgi:hypothetical protein